MTTTVEVHVSAEDLLSALRRDVRAGLSADKKWLPPKWFYDARGGELFDEITRLPSYYPTRAERAILEEVSDEIVTVSAANTLVELGSGTSEKTRLLLQAFERAGRLARFVPFDVDATMLRSASQQVAAEHPGIDVHAVVGDFEHHLPLLPREGRRLVAFLGSTIGNLLPEERKSFLATLASTLHAGDSLLLGTDLVKDPVRLVDAYDDATGITGDFNRNVLRVIDRELGGDFGADSWQHIALWNPDEEWIEMRLRTPAPRTVRLQALDLTVEFTAGEEIRTEVSTKFRREGVRRELAEAGFELRRWWTDADDDFALSLSTVSR